MMTGIETRGAGSRGQEPRWTWAILCLILSLFFLVANAPVSANVSDNDAQFVSAANHSDLDCDHDHADFSGHCHHASAACFAFAQTTGNSLPFNLESSDHLTARQPEALSDRSLPPNLQPPKHPIQA